LSEIAVPILVHGKAIGVVDIENVESHAFNESDQEILETLANYIGFSISNNRYSDRINSLHYHASQLSILTSIDEIAEHTLDAMTTTLELGTCAFLLSKNGELQTILEKGLDETILLREKALEWFSTRTERLREADKLEFLSELEAPIFVDDEVVAILSAKSIQSDKYTEQDKKLLETLASHVASAIQRIRLLEAKIQYEAKLEALHQHAIQLSKAKDIDEILDCSIDAMRNTLGHLFGLICLLEADHLVVHRVMGAYSRKGSPIPIEGQGLINNAFRTGKTSFVNDTRLDKNYRTSRERNLSEIDVPLIIEDKVIGVLNIEQKELNAYTESDRVLLETLANHVALNIQRIRFIEAQIQYEAKLEALHQHTSKLADASSLEEIADNTHDAMVNTLGVGGEGWGGLLGIVEGNLVTWGIESHLEKSQSPIDSLGITYRAIKTGKIQIVNDTRKDDDFVVTQARAQSLGVQMDTSPLSKLDEKVRVHLLKQRDRDGLGVSLSELDVPVKIGDTVVALLNAESIELNAFTEQDQKLLETLASHVASAIQRIRLLEAQTQYEVKLEALHLHTSKLADARNLQEIEDHTIDAMANTLGFSWAIFGIVEDNLLKFTIPKSLGGSGDPLDLSLDGPGLMIRAIRTGETQLIADVRKDVDYIGPHMNESTLIRLESTHSKRVESAHSQLGARTPALSELDVPVKIDQVVVGVICAESIELNAFTIQDQKLLETLANHVSSAMMRLKSDEERERVLQELALERVRVEQADELSRLKNQFISTATHELRTPVTSILGFLELVLDYSSQDLPDTVRKDLNIVFRNAMRLVDMTNDLLDVQRITSGRFEVNLEQVDLVNTLNEVVEELTPMFVEKNQVLLVDAPRELFLQVDETRISQLFINLLRNANKFTPAEGNIGVKVEPFESHVQISVKDSGIGLSEEDIEKLFKPFPAIRHGVNVSSTGLGLAICKGIVDLHNGDIWVESDGPGEGCTFIVRLPVNQ